MTNLDSNVKVCDYHKSHVEYKLTEQLIKHNVHTYKRIAINFLYFLIQLIITKILEYN